MSMYLDNEYTGAIFAKPADAKGHARSFIGNVWIGCAPTYDGVAVE